MSKSKSYIQLQSLLSPLTVPLYPTVRPLSKVEKESKYPLPKINIKEMFERKNQVIKDSNSRRASHNASNVFKHYKV
jgi:hypothetical protein